MEDGTPPPDRVVIECIRNGVAKPEAYTDSKGRFSFQPGQNTYLMMDARTGGGPLGSQSGSVSDRTGGGAMGGQTSCTELRAYLPGYQSSVAMIAGRPTYYVDLGTIVLRRLAHVEGTTISLTSLEAPNDARKAYEKGLKAAGKQQWPESQRELEKAVRVYPRYASAWFELGRALESQNKMAEARQAYGRALEVDGKFINPYLRLAGMAANERKWQEVAEVTGRIIKLNPVDFPEAYFFNSAANFNLRNLEAAEQSGRQTLKLDTARNIPKARHLLGLILAAKQDFAGAAEQLKAYLELAPDAADARTVKQQLAEAEQLAAAGAQKRR